MKVVKVRGEEQDFSIKKIQRAIRLANESERVPSESRMTEEQIEKVVNTITKKLEGFTTINVDDIHTIVEQALVKHNRYYVERAYVLYREEKKNKKKFTDNEEKAIAIIEGNSELRGENANKSIDDNGAISDYFAGILAKSITNKVLPEDVREAHNLGLEHFHDADYFVRPMHNCDLLDTGDMFTNGFQMQNALIEPNKETPFRTACNLLAQINLIVSGRQYGGQTVSWVHTLQFLDSTRNILRKKIIEDYNEDGVTPTKEQVDKKVERKLKDEIYEGVKTYQYQILCHSSSNGQTPFVSNNICLREAENQHELDDLAMIIEAILKRRIKGVKDSSGTYVSPLFPKLLYWTCDGLNVNESDPYFYLTELAAECEAARIQPDIVSEKQTRLAKKGQIIPSMGCRSLLSPIWEEREYPIATKFYFVKGNSTYPYGKFVEKVSFENFENREYKTGYEQGEVSILFRGNTGWLMKKTDTTVTILEPKVYGRWNNGVMTINLPHVALEAVEMFKNKNNDTKVSYTNGVIDEFYKILDKRLKLCRKALEKRFERCAKIKGKNSPILWMHGALSRINADETVGELMNKYPQRASISVGYVGLYETCMALIGKSNTSDEGRILCKDILTYMNNACDDWKNEKHYIGDGSDIGFIEVDKNTWDECSNVNIIYSNKEFPTIYLNEKKFINGKIIWYIQHVNNKYIATIVDDKNLYQINFSIYGTPEESLTYKFALANRRDFGLIENITDKDYVVNSYHVDPRENIDWAKKLLIEGEYLALSPGGAVSYIETTDMTNNPKAIIKVIQFMNEHILYSEFNRKLGVCHNCGYTGDIPLTRTNNGDFIFTCPNCNNTDDSKMDITARICGYLGKVNAGNTNKGRLYDIYSRVLNTDCVDDLDEIEKYMEGNK